MVALIFISVAVKNLKGRPKNAPYRGGFWRGRTVGINPSPPSSIFEKAYIVIASMLPSLRVMASRSGTDPTSPLFRTVAGELLLTKPGRLWSLERGERGFDRPVGGLRELKVVRQHYS